MIKYQFQVDNRPAGPIRKKWEDAAQDAVNAGYAQWSLLMEAIKLDPTAGGSIARID